MLPLEAARRALQLTRLEGLAASTAFLNTDDEAAAAMTQDDVDAAVGALLLYLWCMGLGAFRLAFVDIGDIGLCLLYLSRFPELTSVVLLFVGIVYWRSPAASDSPLDRVQARLWTNLGQVPRGRVRMTACVLYLFAVLLDITWWHSENHATLWGNPWVIAATRAAIAGLVGCFVQKLKSVHPDAHDGHLPSFYNTTLLSATARDANVTTGVDVAPSTAAKRAGILGTLRDGAQKPGWVKRVVGTKAFRECELTVLDYLTSTAQNSWWLSQNSLWLLTHTMLRLLLHAELDLLKERSVICFVMTFAVIFVTVFVGLETHMIMIPSRSAPIGVAACLMPYDLFFLFCLALAQFGWSYIYLNCLNFPLTFCLLASIYVISFLKWGNYYSVRSIARPCFGAMT